MRGFIRGGQFSVLREKRVKGDPAGAQRRGGSRTARGKRVPCSENQQQSLTEPSFKKFDENLLRQDDKCLVIFFYKYASIVESVVMV